MSCKKNLRYLISAVFLTIVVMITAACSQKEIMEDAAGIETPPAQAESAPSPEPADAAVAGEAEKVGQMEHPAAMELARLPKDQYGLVDWAAAIKNGNVKPWDSLEPGAMAAPPFNLDIVVQTKSKFMADVVFPHYVHTLWLTCTNCHTGIFQMKAGGNPEMTMAKIAAGEYCGRCHNRVAFPLTDCNRCHVKPKEAAKKGR